MKRYWAYLKYVLLHKWHLWTVRKHYGVPLLRALLHDWDKFSPNQFISYARTFYKEDGSNQYVMNAAFEYGWNAHQKNNKHHWQYWVIIWDKGLVEPLVMPEKYIREMLADWYAAGRMKSTTPDSRAWYLRDWRVMKLHPTSRTFVENWLQITKEQKNAHDNERLQP